MIKLFTKEEVFKKLGYPDKQSAITTVEKFIAWRDSKTFEDFIQIENRGNLKSKDIYTQIQEEQKTTFPKSQLTQNKWVRFLRKQLEDYLRENNVLPPITEEAKEENNRGTKDNPKHHKSNDKKIIQDAKRVAELQEVVLKQKARIAELECSIESQVTKQNIYAELAAMGASFDN